MVFLLYFYYIGLGKTNYRFCWIYFYWSKLMFLNGLFGFWQARFEVLGIDKISESRWVLAKNIWVGRCWLRVRSKFRAGVGVEVRATAGSFDSVD